MIKEKIVSKVKEYCHTVHTQDRQEVMALWNESAQCSLISPGGKYIGIESIYNDFLLDGIRAAYSRIDLIADEIEVHVVSDECAVVIFAYHTDCDRRETGEWFGIAGLETQVYNKVGDEWKLTHVHYSGTKKE